MKKHQFKAHKQDKQGATACESENVTVTNSPESNDDEAGPNPQESDM